MSVAPNCRDADRLAMPEICGRIGERYGYDVFGRHIMHAAAKEECSLRGVMVD